MYTLLCKLCIYLASPGPAVNVVTGASNLWQGSLSTNNWCLKGTW